jgi:hypothetical protein
LAATALFALLWAIARACVQSITIDEADTYLVWVARPSPSHWEASSNNHVLNSILMRLSTSVFGLSHLSVRAPALLGAAIYILMALALCRLLSPMVRVQWPLFVGLVFNPFIFDHLVAARGYALALGFLLAAIAIAAYSQARAWPIGKACAACSISLALSFAANFSFAIVDAFTLGAIAIWACARTQALQTRVRIAGACILPGLLVTLFVSAPVVLHWPKGQLVYGSHSLPEWFGEVVRDSLYELNPQIVNPMLMKVLKYVKDWIIPVVLALAAWQWGIALRRKTSRPSVPRESAADEVSGGLLAEACPGIAYLMLAVAAASVITHWAMFKLFHVLMPKERTAIWIVPLVMVAIGAVASGRRALTISLYTLSFYFLLCLRLTYFHEWYWDADVKYVYSVLAQYNHNYGVKEVTSNWMYSSALNYYRLASGRETLDEIPGAVELPPGHPIYVLNYVLDEAFLKQQKLRVVYRGPGSEVVVALRPDAEAQWRPPTCGVN